MNQKQRDEKNNAVALFRYALISPVIIGAYTEKSEMDFFINVASKPHEFDGEKIDLSPSTLKFWTYKYRKFGFDGLKPKTRSDIKSSRKLNNEAIQAIADYKKVFPRITAKLIYNKLTEDGYINPCDVSYGTVAKYIRDNTSSFTNSNNVDRRAFEMEFANQCWQADTSHGPYLIVNGKKQKAYLIAIIDDASRLIVYAKFYFADNALNFQATFKSAIKKHGIPKKLFVDNGKTYKNEQLSLICANIGTVLIHARPYSGASKGKIERFFHTCKASWLRGINWDEVKDIDELNNLLNEFINKYNNQNHSSLKDEQENLITPHQRWFKDASSIKRINNELIDEYFLHTVYPTIRDDAIANIKSHEFEVDMKYIKQRITVKYDPNDFTKAWIYENNKSVCEIKPVNKQDNAKVKRNNVIY